MKPRILTPSDSLQSLVDLPSASVRIAGSAAAAESDRDATDRSGGSIPGLRFLTQTVNAFAFDPMREVRRSESGPARSRPDDYPQLIGEHSRRFHFIDARLVDHLEVDGNYVTIHVGADTFLTRTTLKRLIQVLEPFDFVRIDRSVLVNLRRVDYIERTEGGQFAVKMRNGSLLLASRERCGFIAALLRAGLR